MSKRLNFFQKYSKLWMKKKKNLNIHPSQIKTVLLLLIEIIIILIISSILLLKVPRPSTVRYNNDESNVVDLQLLSESISKSLSHNSIQNLKSIIKKSYQTYSKQCFGSDFIRPLTGECVNHSGLALTAIDSLDTLILIGDTDDVEQINEYLKSKDSFCKPKSTSFLHTKDLIAHIVGGLISAYSLTANDLYLKKAIECADFSLSAFHGDIPKPLINGNEKQSKDYLWAQGTTLSESSSFPVEFRGLTCLTKSKKYINRITRYFKILFLKCINFQEIKETIYLLCI